MKLTETVREELLYLGASLDSSFLVAISGGADSSALLLAMHSVAGRKERLTSAHLDHGIRPGSREEAKFVVKFSRDLGVKVVTGMLEPGELESARREHGSLEAAMRELRYRFLFDAARRSGSEWILTGHTADDQSETVLFRISRRMDWRSLGGIPPRRGKILRPLLGSSRSDVRDFCMKKGIKPLTDPSNYDEDYARNRIRHTILPGLKADLGMDVARLLCRTGKAARKLADIEADMLGSYIPGYGSTSTRSFERDHLFALPHILRYRFISDFLYREIKTFQSLKLVEDVLAFMEAGRNGSMSLPGGRTLVLSYGQASVRTDDGTTGAALPRKGLELTVPGCLVLESSDLAITASWSVLQKPGEYPSGDTVLLSANSVRGSLWVRNRLPGDHFTPIGSKNKKKLKEFLVNRKVPREIRDRIPVFTGDDGEILWVGGVEISQKASMAGVKGERGILLSIKRLSRDKGNECVQDHDDKPDNQ